MKLLEKLERSIEQLVEGVPQAVFRQKLQPAELGRKLEREMLGKKQAGLGSPLVPNRFRVHLHPSDYEPIADFRNSLENQMESWLTQVAHRKGCHFVSQVDVSIHEAGDAAKRSPRIESRFTEQSRAGSPPPQHTATLARPAPSGKLTASLTLLDGPPTRRSFIVPFGVTTIGRSPDNDVFLDHRDVSRRHARIDCAATEIRIHDLASTNGTRVNGEHVSMTDLFQGDVIQLGSLRLRIDVHTSNRAR